MTPPGIDLPPRLPGLLREAHARLRRRIEQLAPVLAEAVLPWMEQRAARGRPPEDYFTHPMAFPLMLLPWWLDEEMGGAADLGLQSDLLYSSMCGYYVIRLIDDVMDASAAADPGLLPAACVLHAEFQSTYARRFPPEHPFWERFHRAWAEGNEAALAEARLSSIDEDAFVRVSARKVSPGIIPMRAVAFRHGAEELPPAWADIFPKMCAFHQRGNDLFDWQRDHAVGGRTWFLDEGARHRRPDETLAKWVAREGFELGIARLERDLGALEASAKKTECAALSKYVGRRRLLLDEAARGARAGLAALGPLLAALGRGEERTS